MHVLVVFRDTIYASGLERTLAGAPGIECVDQATSIALAWDHEALVCADVVVLDSDLGGAAAFIQELAAGTTTRILVCLHDSAPREVLEAIAGGSAGALARDRITPDTLLAAVAAVASGIYPMDTGSMRAVRASAQHGAGLAHHGSIPVAGAAAGSAFTAREQTVLSLVAAGLSNREIAERLSYSERTIKTVVHDVVMKLGVKSRSQAVARAVREQII